MSTKYFGATSRSLKRFTHTMRKNFDNIKKDLAKLKSKIPFKIMLKDFRTTFGTRCSEKGINTETIKKWLGHTTSKTTERFYIKVLSQQEKNEKNKFDSD